MKTAPLAIPGPKVPIRVAAFIRCVQAIDNLFQQTPNFTHKLFRVPTSATCCLHRQ